MSAEHAKVNAPGVYLLETDGALSLVHAYEDGEYTLAGVADRFGLGEPTPPAAGAASALDLTHRAVRELKVLADAHAFDHEPEFIEMCGDLWRLAQAREWSAYRFLSFE